MALCKDKGSEGVRARGRGGWRDEVICSSMTFRNAMVGAGDSIFDWLGSLSMDV